MDLWRGLRSGTKSTEGQVWEGLSEEGIRFWEERL